jgi:hypothetical protein
MGRAQPLDHLRDGLVGGARRAPAGGRVMPTAIHTNDTRRRLDAVVTGVLTFEEAADGFQRLRAGVDRYDRVVIDLTQAELRWSKPQVQRLADAVREARRRSVIRARMAIITNNQVIYGMARMFEMFCQLERPQLVRVFRSADEATRWVDDDS